MKKESNARFLGIIIDGPLKVYRGEPTNVEKIEEDPNEGDAPEPDPEEMPDQDWAGQPTEYDPS